MYMESIDTDKQVKCIGHRTKGIKYAHKKIVFFRVASLFFVIYEPLPNHFELMKICLHYNRTM
jgi:hypothetical protein